MCFLAGLWQIVFSPCNLLLVVGFFSKLFDEDLVSSCKESLIRIKNSEI